MSEPFDVNQYWLERGRTYAGEERLALEYHRIQERFLMETLRESGLPMRSILELGCGFGRVTRLVAEQFPDATITALDLSPDQLANARQYCHDRSSITFQSYDLYSGETFPGSPHDVALAIEVFLHHPPEAVRGWLRSLREAVRAIVHIDWFEPWSGPLPRHVWIHDFPTYYRELGWEWASLPVPAKTEGKQQVLFASAAPLPERWQARRGDGFAATHADETSNLDATSWEHQVAFATADLCRIIPPGETFLLVDGNEWGLAEFPEARRALPFLEKDGQYWGPPADDTAAWNALQASRESGAAWLVIGWNARWWLDHYRTWHERLRREYPCALDNDRVVIFKLRS